MKKISFILCCLCFFNAMDDAMAKKFSNRLIEFELPLGWECQLDIRDWICQGKNAQQKKEAIIIMSAKDRSISDSLDKYQQHLKEVRSYTLAGSEKNYVSQPKYSRSRQVHGHLWVDALHLSSEVPGFYTRYMATVNGDVGLAITFTVAQNKYQEYQSIFDSIIASLKFFQQKDTPRMKLNAGRKRQDLLSFDGFAERPEVHAPKAKKRQNNAASALAFFAVAALSAGGFIYYRKRKQKK